MPKPEAPKIQRRLNGIRPSRGVERDARLAREPDLDVRLATALQEVPEGWLDVKPRAARAEVCATVGLHARPALGRTSVPGWAVDVAVS